jgi:hypothetical protein
VGTSHNTTGNPIPSRQAILTPSTKQSYSFIQSLPSSQELNKSTPQRSPTQKQRICYYSDRRPAQLYRLATLLPRHRPVTQPLPAEASQWPPGKILTKPLPQLTGPLAACIVYRQYSSRCRHASLQPPELFHIWTALFRATRFSTAQTTDKQ